VDIAVHGYQQRPGVKGSSRPDLMKYKELQAQCSSRYSCDGRITVLGLLDRSKNAHGRWAFGASLLSANFVVKATELVAGCSEPDSCQRWRSCITRPASAPIIVSPRNKTYRGSENFFSTARFERRVDTSMLGIHMCDWKSSCSARQLVVQPKLQS